jgi:hypothetical protein
MFNIDASISDLKVKDRNLFKVLFSMNNHHVANPEMSLEEARSYVFFFKDGGRYQAYVGLYFIPSDRRMFYTYSSSSFGENELPAVEEEARSFAEDLGAMLDEIHFSGLSTEDKNNWIDAQDMLNQKKKEPEPEPIPVAAPVPEPTVAVQQQPVEQAPPAAAPQPVLQPAAPPAEPAAVQPDPEPVVPPPAAAVPVRPQPEAIPQTKQPSEQPVARPRVAPETRVPLDLEEKELSAPPQIQRKRAPLREESADADVEDSDVNEAANSMDDVLEQAVRAGVVKAPKAKLKKDIRTSTGSIGREKEALARLLSSF